MRRVGTIRLRSHGGLIPATLQQLATGASISADGTTLAVRTYTDAYVWHVSHDDVAAALRHQPRRVQLPLQQQGEGVCVVGHWLVLDSEGRDSPIVRVRLPAERAGPSPSISSSSASSSVPSSPTAAASPGATRSGGDTHLGLELVIGAAAVVLVAAAGMGLRRRRE
jgi:hypothetical protein